MKIQVLFLKDPCHGRLVGEGHTLSVGRTISAIEFDASAQMFKVVTPVDTQYVPASNVRNCVVAPESNEKPKGK